MIKLDPTVHRSVNLGSKREKNTEQNRVRKWERKERERKERERDHKDENRAEKCSRKYAHEFYKIFIHITIYTLGQYQGKYIYIYIHVIILYIQGVIEWTANV